MRHGHGADSRVTARVGEQLLEVVDLPDGHHPSIAAGQQVLAVPTDIHGLAKTGIVFTLWFWDVPIFPAFTVICRVNGNGLTHYILDTDGRSCTSGSHPSHIEPQPLAALLGFPHLFSSEQKTTRSPSEAVNPTRCSIIFPKRTTRVTLLLILFEASFNAQKKRQ